MSDLFHNIVNTIRIAIDNAVVDDASFLAEAFISQILYLVAKKYADKGDYTRAVRILTVSDVSTDSFKVTLFKLDDLTTMLIDIDSADDYNLYDAISSSGRQEDLLPLVQSALGIILEFSKITAKGLIADGIIEDNLQFYFDSNNRLFINGSPDNRLTFRITNSS